jgi:hypothetical protein
VGGMKRLLPAAAITAVALVLSGCAESALLTALKFTRNTIVSENGVGDVSLTAAGGNSQDMYIAYKDNAKTLFVLRGTHYGETWGSAIPANPASAAGATRGAADETGKVYVAHINGANVTVCKSVTNGATWTQTNATNASYLLDSSSTMAMCLGIPTYPLVVTFNSDTLLQYYEGAGTATALSGSTAGYGFGSSLVCDGTNVYAGYWDKTSSGASSYAAMFSGGTWTSKNIQSRGTSGPSGATAMAYGGGRVWEAYTFSDNEIWMTSSGTGLAGFGAAVPLVYSGAGTLSSLRMAYSGSAVHIAFFDTSDSSIKVVTSTDDGAHWSTPLVVESGLTEHEFGMAASFDPTDTQFPTLAFCYVTEGSSNVVFSTIRVENIP